MSILSLFPRLLLLALLAGCGQKPDGTPYGVNPAKVARDQGKEVTDSARRYDHYKKGMPKGAEVNAISNGGTQGQVDMTTGQ
jgi:predicted small lipoprotein YifL